MSQKAWEKSQYTTVDTTVALAGNRLVVRLMSAAAARDSGLMAGPVLYGKTSLTLIRNGTRQAADKQCAVSLRLVRGRGRPSERVLVLADGSRSKTDQQHSKLLVGRVSVAEEAPQPVATEPAAPGKKLGQVNNTRSRYQKDDARFAEQARMIEALRRAVRQLMGLSPTAPELPDIPGAL